MELTEALHFAAGAPCPLKGQGASDSWGSPGPSQGGLSCVTSGSQQPRLSTLPGMYVPLPFAFCSVLGGRGF